MTKPTTVVETLRAAKALIETRDRWTQIAEARNAAGEYVVANSPDACKYCPAGALLCVLETDGDDRFEPLYEASLHVLAEVLRHNPFATDYGVVTLFNDNTTTTHADVIGVFNSAIELAEVA